MAPSSPRSPGAGCRSCARNHAVPGLRRLRERIAAGEFGTIHLVTCYQWDEQPPPAAFRAHSGGIAIDMGVHGFDQLRWLTGQDIASLAAVASGRAPDGIADVDAAQAIATLSGGASGFISLGRELRGVRGGRAVRGGHRRRRRRGADRRRAGHRGGDFGVNAVLRVGIIGYGMMGKAHCYGYRVAPMLVASRPGRRLRVFICEPGGRPARRVA